VLRAGQSTPVSCLRSAPSLSGGRGLLQRCRTIRNSDSLINKDQYDRVVSHIRELQSRSHFWSVELYNCNAFVADIADFMGLKVPSSTWIYPKVFVNNLRKINTGHPEAADQLVSDNVKEMSNPTRDGRAMIASGLIHPDVRSTTGPVSPAPNVTIGAVRVSNRPASSAGGSQNSP
jgi:hypothetical protein